MRNAALVLGIIAGVIGLFIGFFSWGWIELSERVDVPEMTNWIDNPNLIQAVGLVAPVLAIAGGAMAKSRAVAGGVLLLVSAGGMWHAFGFGAFTMFPIVMSGLGGILALAATKPDEH